MEKMCTIPIVVENKVNHAFIRANYNLLEKYSELFPDTLTFKEKMPILKDLWEKEYNCQINFSDEYGFEWTEIKFVSETARTLFLLSHSSE